MNVKEFKKKAIIYLGFLWFSLTLWPFYLIGAHEYNDTPIQDPMIAILLLSGFTICCIGYLLLLIDAHKTYGKKIFLIGLTLPFPTVFTTLLCLFFAAHLMRMTCFYVENYRTFVKHNKALDESEKRQM
jgi:hypothetical protein